MWERCKNIGSFASDVSMFHIPGLHLKESIAQTSDRKNLKPGDFERIV